jgi:hypothetical protein
VLRFVGGGIHFDLDGLKSQANPACGCQGLKMEKKVDINFSVIVTGVRQQRVSRQRLRTRCDDN